MVVKYRKKMTCSNVEGKVAVEKERSKTEIYGSVNSRDQRRDSTENGHFLFCSRGRRGKIM